MQKHKHPVLFDSILSVGDIVPYTPKIQRFLSIYKSLESLDFKCIPIELKVIRHGLSHSPHALSNPTTINKLMDLFGTTSIDLNKFRHNNIFYIHFAKLLILHDQIIYTEIRNNLENITKGISPFAKI